MGHPCRPEPARHLQGATRVSRQVVRAVSGQTFARSCLRHSPGRWHQSCAGGHPAASHALRPLGPSSGQRRRPPTFKPCGTRPAEIPRRKDRSERPMALAASRHPSASRGQTSTAFGPVLPSEWPAGAETPGVGGEFSVEPVRPVHRAVCAERAAFGEWSCPTGRVSVGFLLVGGASAFCEGPVIANSPTGQGDRASGPGP